MNRTEKESLVSELSDLFASRSFVAVAHYKGLTVRDLETLRGQMREAGAGFRVTKNRLTKLALKGSKFEGLSDLFTGPTAIAFSDDPVSAAKVCATYAKKNDKLVILGGAMDGQVLDASGIETLSKLPSLDELRAKLVGMIQTPATRIAGVLQAPGGQVARVLHAYSEKDAA
ncbi:50S ribosomal protein L10 [Roseospirillum parvum]|uniref:Large ribosomal subunit protein uL10 n=1 Tax=Roseospirillum parvum TaxID=83401 RepID=A0A1G8BEE9_9PROT|nr:50S ribosomal protein L10 [Roseospirillum parvum]SDH31606.1 large subunit ribosomal protein L10 [Roseospirillum parvum]